MKRIISSFFLCIFLFQVGGYYIVFWAMQQNVNHSLLQRLDDGHYSEDELVVIALPISLPYPVHADSFERVDGTFEHQGQSFRLVKQRLENDTLHIVCIKDTHTTRLSGALTDVTKFANSLSVAGKKASTFLANLYKDFTSTEFELHVEQRDVYYRTWFAHITPGLSSVDHGVESPPPESLI